MKTNFKENQGNEIESGDVIILKNGEKRLITIHSSRWLAIDVGAMYVSGEYCSNIEMKNWYEGEGIERVIKHENLEIREVE